MAVVVTGARFYGRKNDSPTPQMWQQVLELDFTSAATDTVWNFATKTGGSLAAGGATGAGAILAALENEGGVITSTSSVGNKKIYDLFTHAISVAQSFQGIFGASFQSYAQSTGVSSGFYTMSFTGQIPTITFNTANAPNGSNTVTIVLGLEPSNSPVYYSI